VIRICGAIEIGLVARDARSGVGQVICATRAEASVVTLLTLQRGMCSVQRETSAGMVEGCTSPIRGGVALLTNSRESSLHMVRTGRAVEIGLMAGHARSGIGQVIRPTRAECRVVALCALQRSVGAVKREAGRGVIESGSGPAGGVVALRAILREARLHVIRVGRAVEVRLMAGNASRAVRQIVSTGRTECRVVALCALQRHVGAGQREACGRVIESGTGPGGRVMALRAVLREAGLYVIRVACVIEVRLMAGNASRASKAIRAGRAEGRVMALRALQGDVRSSQREARRRVIE